MERIKIIVRVRPRTKFERKKGDVRVVEYDSASQKLVIKNTNVAFPCSSFIGPSVSQSVVFNDFGIQELVHNAMDGYSATVFAYGMTGSGKTYTVFGDTNTGLSSKTAVGGDGFLPRSAAYMMTIASTRQDIIKYKFRVTCAEIYNDTVFDVLSNDRKARHVRESREHGFYVQDMTVVPAASLTDLLRVIHFASSNRKVDSHSLNDRSNRSHCLWTVYIDSTPVKIGGAKYGKLTMVDLAGSERSKV